MPFSAGILNFKDFPAQALNAAEKIKKSEVFVARFAAAANTPHKISLQGTEIRRNSSAGKEKPAAFAATELT